MPGRSASTGSCSARWRSRALRRARSGWCSGRKSPTRSRCAWWPTRSDRSSGQRSDTFAAPMTPKQLERLALSFPEAVEAPHFERRSFRVGKKIFATMTADGSEAMVRVAPYQKIEALLESHPEIFFSYGGWTEKNGSLGVKVKKIDAAMMKELMTDSWKHVAPKRALAALEGKRKAR